MRRALLSILVASLLLVSRATLGAARLPDLDGQGESGLSLRLRLLPWGEERAGRWWPLEALSSPPTPGPETAALEELRRRLADLSKVPKRHHDPPLSIDLTFHLLRHMLEISRAQSQQEQAEKNRLVLDSVGK